MAGFSEENFKKKLAELNSTQQSIQTLSLWLIHHRKHAANYVKLWYTELLKASKPRKLTFIYLANDILQNGRKKGKDIHQQFGTVLADAFKHTALETDSQVISKLNRIISIWGDRKIFDTNLLQQFKASLEKLEPVAKRKRIEEVKLALQEEMNQTDSDDANEEPPDAQDMNDLISSLSKSASSDADVRQKIAALPQEVSDASSLKKIKSRSEANSLSSKITDACTLLNDYNTRLAQELLDRKKLSRVLPLFITSQKDKLVESQQRLEEFRSKLAGVSAARIELEQHIKSLPDLTQLQAPEQGLAPLPSAGDLFSL